MSLFQCENCGCVENTALAVQGFKGWPEKSFDWSYAPERKGKLLCSACGPVKTRTGSATEFGEWHDEFERIFLPIGQFKTNSRGNLEHIETGDTDYRKFAIEQEAGAVNYKDMSEYEITLAILKIELMGQPGTEFLAQDECVLTGLKSSRVEIITQMGRKQVIDLCHNWGDIGPLIDKAMISTEAHGHGSNVRIYGYSKQGLHEVFVPRSELIKGYAICYLMINEGDGQ